MPARIFQINSSSGGVPKHALSMAVVNTLGILGDDQNDKKHHGGPDRALVIFSLGRLLALQAEGHPIYPGSIGENVTISGLDWGELRPGMRLKLGQVEAEISGYAAPCSTIRDSFSDQNYNRVGQPRFPGWSRLTLRVLKPGRMAIGDPVKLFAG